LELLQEGHNIAFTHSLYTRLTEDHLFLIEQWGYVLVIDEEVSMIEEFKEAQSNVEGHSYSAHDLKYLYQSEKITIDESEQGRVKWLWDDYGDKGQYSRLKTMCDLGMVYCVIEKDGEQRRDHRIHSLVVQLPESLVRKCHRVVLVTYMFQGSLLESFLELKGIPWTHFDKDTEGVTLRFDDEQIKERLRDLITFVETKTTEQISNRRMSYTWYNNTATKEDLDMISRAIRSVGDKAGASRHSMMWTAPKALAFPHRNNGRVVKPSGYSAKWCFVYSSSKATNEFSHKDTLVHCLHKHPNVFVEKYLNHYGVSIDKDAYALSELIQWVWRSQIRDMKPINLCIAPKRMRWIFEQWLGLS